MRWPSQSTEQWPRFLSKKKWSSPHSQQNSDLGSFPRQTIQHHFASTTDAGEAKVDYKDLQDLVELTAKTMSFSSWELECKSWKSRETCSSKQVWPWRTKWSRAKANRVLPREHSGHSKHSFPTTQEMTLHKDITKWSLLKLDWLYSLQLKMEKLYTVSKNKTGSWPWLRSWPPYCKI